MIYIYIDISVGSCMIYSSETCSLNAGFLSLCIGTYIYIRISIYMSMWVCINGKGRKKHITERTTKN